MAVLSPGTRVLINTPDDENRGGLVVNWSGTPETHRVVLDDKTKKRRTLSIESLTEESLTDKMEDAGRPVPHHGSGGGELVSPSQSAEAAARRMLRGEEE